MYESGVQERVWTEDIHSRVISRYICKIHRATGLCDPKMACQHLETGK